MQKAQNIQWSIRF